MTTRVCSSRDKSAAYYRWMYYDNPAGPAFGFLARHGDRIVSSFAVAPKVMQVGGRRVRVGKTMDMFTDPDYQGMGLIKRCAERVFAAAREAGIDGWYVTPSVNSYPIFTGKWGYREDFDVIYRARIIDLEAVLTAAQPRLGRAVGSDRERRVRSTAPSVAEVARRVLRHRTPPTSTSGLTRCGRRSRPATEWRSSATRPT